MIWIIIWILVAILLSPLWLGAIVYGIENILVEHFGYLPDRIAAHKDNCSCEICKDNRQRKIERLEKELGIGQWNNSTEQ